MERRLTRFCNEVEPLWFDLLASAERKRKFLVKLFSKRLWVKRSEGKALGPGTPGTITFDSKVYCVILYMEDLPIYVPNWDIFYGALPYCIKVINIRY